jgi:hypothetical protein
MNKGRRHELKMLKYRKRLHRWVSGITRYHTRTGEIIYHPTVEDIIADNGQNCYRTTSSPCSCWCCSGEKKYNRAKEKRDTQRDIQNYKTGEEADKP